MFGAGRCPASPTRSRPRRFCATDSGSRSPTTRSGRSHRALARVTVPARRGRPELALANIAGTIIHFAALNAGVIALVKPLTLGHDTTHFYLPAAAVSPAILAATLLTRRRLGRIEGASLLALYLAYVTVAITISS